MPLTRLTDSQMQYFDEQPETSMGVHVLTLDETGSKGPRFVFVLGGQVFLDPEPEALEAVSEWRKKEQALWNESGRPDDAPIDEETGQRFRDWHDGLAETSHDLSTVPILSRTHLAFSLPLPATVPPPPPAPSHVYGHLPFTGTTGTGDVFYRCEPWPVSRRINVANKTIAAGTFVFPESERSFVPTGFAAVGRYALPNLLPACYCWRLDPKPGWPVACGASVPLYGQAGGGVEGCFLKDTPNDGPFKLRVALPAL